MSATSMSEVQSTAGPATDAGDPVVRQIQIDGSRRAAMRSHHCFACGDLNVHGLQLRLHLDPGACWTETALDGRFAGWDGIVHGGIICAILDEVMAWALISEDCWGLTARMAVDFRRPVPVGHPIRAEGRFVDRRRRILRTEAQMIDAATGEVLATAQGTYVDAPPDRKAELKRRYQFRLLPG